MNTLLFIGKCCLSGGLACAVSIAFSVTILCMMVSVTDFLGLNYAGHNYLAIHTSMVSLVVSWIISFTCFMSILR
jgi:hypothetical protein